MTIAFPTIGNAELVVSLTDSSVGNDRVRPSRVGGKASSLATLYATEGLGARVPKAHALTVDFFQPWIDKLTKSDDFRALAAHTADTGTIAEDEQIAILATALCHNLQAASLLLTLSEAQSSAIRTLVSELKGSLAAVRSSAPEEDGSGASFAGAFETKLAVETTTCEGLETAVKECFASLWDYRVLLYKQKQYSGNDQNNKIGFAVVVMEMVDSVIAGVAFSANPLNSDRDELMIDSSWGLGESVVDGSVTADRYVVDKIHGWKILEESIGKKGNEKRLGTGVTGVVNKSIEENDPRYSESSLNQKQIEELSKLVCLIERTYGVPMDVEWAFVADNDETLKPKLLQARPITTLYSLDPEMMTEPGKKRVLYFDANVISEATTTSPFTTMDLDFFYQLFESITFGTSFGEAKSQGFGLYNNTDASSILYNGMTRQYMNMGYTFNFVSTEFIAKKLEFIDPYFSSIIRSKDCDRKKYRTNSWIPKGVTLKSWWKILRTQITFEQSGHYAEDPKGAMEAYLAKVEVGMEQFGRVAEQDFRCDGSVGLLDISTKLYETIKLTTLEECCVINNILLGVTNKVDEERRNGKTEEIKEEYEALCGGYEGDELMEMNIALYRLAQSLPKAIWDEYKGENGTTALAERIQEERGLPVGFFDEWKSFMKKYGFDGQNQLFIGCPRYDDNPERLLEKMRMNSMEHIKDPSVMAKQMLEKRRAVMAKHEEEAKREAAQSHSFWDKRRTKKKLAELQKRNLHLDHLMKIRNAPKLHLTKFIGTMRTIVLKIEKKFISDGRLEEKGDIFHLKIEEADRALLSQGRQIDLMHIIRPRKAVYERALAANICPLLVDSRCRILKPDPPISNEPGTLVGAAISPGVATGKVRIIRDLSAEQTRGFGVGANGEQENHILCAVVTGPAWTPLFASASAVVLQIGGVLQHGALCAREYGKPAVSNIDVYSLLRDGMTVSVDGNTGIVKILDDGNEGSQ